jgi:hypothetical protein
VLLQQSADKTRVSVLSTSITYVTDLGNVPVARSPKDSITDLADAVDSGHCDQGNSRFGASPRSTSAIAWRR